MIEELKEDFYEWMWSDFYYKFTEEEIEEIKKEIPDHDRLNG